MPERRRFKQTETLERRFLDEAARFRKQAQSAPPGIDRKRRLRPALQAETASHSKRHVSEACPSECFRRQSEFGFLAFASEVRMQRVNGFAVLCLVILVALITVKTYGNYRDCRDGLHLSVSECLRPGHVPYVPSPAG